MLNKKYIFNLCAILMLTACAHKSGEINYANLAEEVEAIKEDGGYYKVGKTYTVMGQTYTPKEDYSYSEVGIASWYGDDFHDKRTANGETYNMRAITAAHRTLPLPSIVKVTNLENGKSIIARVNDRGPYVKNRIIDVSQKGAELLGYKNNGTAKVRVEILADESKALKEAMLSKNNKSKTYADALPTNKISTTTATTAVNKPLTLAENTALKPAETGPFFVQVGAFSDYDKAQNLADSMKRFGNVSIFEAYLSKDGVYRVRLGAYNSRNEALKILDRLLDYGHSDVSIIHG